MDFLHYVDQMESLFLSGLTQGQRDAALRIPSLDQLLGRVPGRILIVAPHPDDECLMSGLSLRARNECGSEIWVFPYSFGSEVGRQEERKKEWKSSLQVLGFKGVDSNSFTLESAMLHYRPEAIVIPNIRDAHPTHIRCSQDAWNAARIVVDQAQVELRVFETEYWGQIESPNLLIPLPSSIVKQMGQALLCHEGEIIRNPYHLSLPAYLMDQQRRGSEILSGFGANAGTSVFAQMYRASLLAP